MMNIEYEFECSNMFVYQPEYCRDLSQLGLGQAKAQLEFWPLESHMFFRGLVQASQAFSKLTLARSIIIFGSSYLNEA